MTGSDDEHRVRSNVGNHCSPSGVNLRSSAVETCCRFSEVPLPCSSCQRYFVLVLQKWAKEFQQISILTAHRSESERHFPRSLLFHLNINVGAFFPPDMWH